MVIRLHGQRIEGRMDSALSVSETDLKARVLRAVTYHNYEIAARTGCVEGRLVHHARCMGGDGGMLDQLESC